MSTLIALLIICAVVAVLLWLVSQIPFGPPILKQILAAVIIILAIIRVLPML